MERKMTLKSSRLADDIRASLREAHNHASGKTTKTIVHRVTPKETEAREARLMLGLSQDEFAALIGTAVGTIRKWELGTRRPSGAARTLISVIKNEPKAVRRALTKANDVA
jgi:putative transcriptional regulator